MAGGAGCQLQGHRSAQGSGRREGRNHRENGNDHPPIDHIAIIGGGPAGLRAAEIAAAAGARVTVYEAKASVGRKFLVAGRGGLNLTKAEPAEIFATRYAGPGMPPEFWREQIAAFDGEALRAWTRSLGIETVVASTKRVYPREMKGAPLLRRWIRKLRDSGVEFAVHHRWTGLQPGSSLSLRFDHLGEEKTVEAGAAVLALGGASWPDTGSDGTWVQILSSLGVQVAPLAAANCGWEVAWPDTVLAFEGQPLKNVVVRAGEAEAPGELLITRYGLEGGAIYALGAALRSMPDPRITVDFKPTQTVDQLLAKLGIPRLHPLTEARRCWKLSDAACAILESRPANQISSPAALARLVKACLISLRGPRPIAEAISSAGGVRWSELDANLMLRALPGVFVAGEMIDWEAPTGGYLLHGCLVSGAHAARSAYQWVASQHS